MRLEFPLLGPGGEPIDLWRTFVSHGVAELPPMRVDEENRRFEITVSLPTSRPRTVRIAEGRPGFGRVTILGRSVGARTEREARKVVEHVLRLDEDLSAFYERAAADPDLSWVRAGAGRMIRSQTVFEEVVKSICTTNCAWGATIRMVTALVEHLGAAAPGAPATGSAGRAFPTPQAMAGAGPGFYRDVARAGYRGAYLLQLAESVAEGRVDLESLGRAGPEEISDEEVSARLQALPGVGPYAAAHTMMMLGRYSPLILDSWTRPTYARLRRRKEVKDSAILRRFRRYGRYAGLAFWLFLTRDEVEAPPPA